MNFKIDENLPTECAALLRGGLADLEGQTVPSIREPLKHVNPAIYRPSALVTILTLCETQQRPTPPTYHCCCTTAEYSIRVVSPCFQYVLSVRHSGITALPFIVNVSFFVTS